MMSRHSHGRGQVSPLPSSGYSGNGSGARTPGDVNMFQASSPESTSSDLQLTKRKKSKEKQSHKQRNELVFFVSGKGKSSACSPLKALYFVVLAAVLAAAVTFAVLYFQEKAHLSASDLGIKQFTKYLNEIMAMFRVMEGFRSGKNLRF